MPARIARSKTRMINMPFPRLKYTHHIHNIHRLCKRLVLLSSSSNTYLHIENQEDKKGSAKWRKNVGPTCLENLSSLSVALRARWRASQDQVPKSVCVEFSSCIHGRMSLPLGFTMTESTEEITNIIAFDRHHRQKNGRGDRYAVCTYELLSTWFHVSWFCLVTEFRCHIEAGIRISKEFLINVFLVIDCSYMETKSQISIHKFGKKNQSCLLVMWKRLRFYFIFLFISN